MGRRKSTCGGNQKAESCFPSPRKTIHRLHRFPAVLIGENLWIPPPFPLSKINQESRNGAAQKATKTTKPALWAGATAPALISVWVCFRGNCSSRPPADRSNSMEGAASPRRCSGALCAPPAGAARRYRLQPRTRRSSADYAASTDSHRCNLRNLWMTSFSFSGPWKQSACFFQGLEISRRMPLLWAGATAPALISVWVCFRGSCSSRPPADCSGALCAPTAGAARR